MYEMSDGQIPVRVETWLNAELGLGVLYAPEVILPTLAWTDRNGDRKYKSFRWVETRKPTLAEAISAVAGK